MNLAASYRRKRWSTFIVVLVAALLFVASPITSVAHLLAAHGANAVQTDDGQQAPHAPLCKLCLGLAAGSVAAHAPVHSFVVVSSQQTSPEAAPVVYFRSVWLSPYSSRAPPIL